MNKSAFTFDAYSCSIDCAFDDFSRVLEKDGFKFTRINPKYSYEYAFNFTNDFDVSVLVMFGGPSDLLFVSVMGDYSNRLFELTRPYSGRLSRADVKIDFDDSSIFDELVRPLLSLAHSKNIRISQVGDWAFQRDGRTLYVGSRSSVYMVRLYEKFKQSDLYDDVVSGRVRLELEIKPDKPIQKERAFSLNAFELLETSSTYAPLFRSFCSDLSSSVSLTQPRKLSNLAVTVKHLSKQYNSTFEKILEHCDGDLSEFYNILMTGDL